MYNNFINILGKLFEIYLSIFVIELKQIQLLLVEKNVGVVMGMALYIMELNNKINMGNTLNYMEQAAKNNAIIEKSYVKDTIHIYDEHIEGTALRSFRLGYHYREQEMFENMQFYMEYCMNYFDQNPTDQYVTPMQWIKNYKHF
jgi:hypothetical protein